MFRFYTAGESHGREVLAIVEGLPAGLKIDMELINRELKRRQGGYGRGGRMRIESDKVEFVAGIRRGKTIGSPVVMKLVNADYKIDELYALEAPRPGHGDLAGALKYGTDDARDILERASARETAARVMAGALSRQVLEAFDVECIAYVESFLKVTHEPNLKKVKLSKLMRDRDKSEFYMLSAETDDKLKRVVNAVAKKGDTVGGVVTAVLRGLPAGLGNHSQWDRKLDGQLAQAVMSIQAFKAVEIGAGFQCAVLPGSELHDYIYYKKGAHPATGGYYRKTNNAGGLEAGMSNGEDIVVRAAMKPIATLRPPIKAKSVHLKTKQATRSTPERGDITAVPAASVVLENMVVLPVVGAFLEKFGGDSMLELKRNYKAYLKQLNR